jgi:hypothetical protein
MDKEKKERSKKNIVDSMFWWLKKDRPFYIGDEYRIELVRSNGLLLRGNSVKILITNLKNNPENKDGK